MSTYSQLPGELNVVVAHADGLAITGSLGFSTAGDTLTAVVYEDTAAGYAAAIAANGGATQSTAQSRFGGKSAAFDGSGDYLTVTNSSGLTFAGDFTIECFVRFASKPSNYIAFFAGSSGATQMFLTTHESGNNLRWGLSATAEYASGNFTWALDTWYHVAVRRQSGAVTLWVDGTNITTGSPTNTSTYSGGLVLFGAIGSVNDFHGHVDEFRITNGVARTITVPAAAFPDS